MEKYTIEEEQIILNNRRTMERIRNRKQIRDGIKQKLMGLCCIALGLISITIEGDITVAMMLVPFGIYIVLTKNRMID